jgi:uncharacterized membrane protein
MDTQFSVSRPESVGDSLTRAWVALKANIWLFAGFFLLFGIASSIVFVIPLVNLAGYLFSFILPAAFYTAFEAADGGREIRFSDFFSWTPQTSRLLIGALIMFGISVALFFPILMSILFVGFSIPTSLQSDGAVFSTGLVILGFGCLLLIFVVGVFAFSLIFLLLNTDKSIGEVLRLSWRTGWKNLGGVFLWTLLLIGLYLLGLLALVIGVLVTIPLAFGTQYFYLRSRFPKAGDKWDFDTTPPSDPYRLS